MLKKLLLFCLVVAPISVFAQDKIAHINAQEIFAKMPEFAQVETKLAAKGETIKQTASAIEAEYTALLEKFKNDTVEPSVSVVADRQKQVEQLQERYQNFMRTSQEEFEQDQQKEFRPLQEKMQNAIKQVGDENNFAYIIDVQNLLYINPNSVDASKLVKAKLGIKE